MLWRILLLKFNEEEINFLAVHAMVGYVTRIYVRVLEFFFLIFMPKRS